MKDEDRKVRMFPYMAAVLEETQQDIAQFLFNAAHYRLTISEGNFISASRVEEKFRWVIRHAEIEDVFKLVMDYTSQLINSNSEGLQRMTLYRAADFKEQGVDRDKVRILVNVAECRSCGERVWSVYTQDVNSCRCGNVKVDGGLYNLKRTVKDSSMYNDKSVFVKKDGGDN